MSTAEISQDFAFELSFAQERLWFLDQFAPNSATYNSPFVFRFYGPLNQEVLRQSFERLIERHEILRTTFVVRDGRPIQAITASLDLPLEVVDLSALPQHEQELAVQQRSAQEAGKPFDLARGPLLRLVLLRLSDTSHVLLLTVHHIIWDGWSMGIFGRDLEAFYTALLSGRPPELEDLAIQYVDFTHWQRQWIADAELERQLEYWKQQLQGLALVELPTDHPRPALLSFRGAQQTRMLPQPLTEALRNLSRSEGVTLFMILLTTFEVLLSRYSGQSDIVVGSPIANRTNSELEQLIGFFVNTLVLRADLAGDPAFRELLRRVYKMTVAAYEYQDIPFEKLVEELQPERDPSRTPLFQIMFAVQESSSSVIKLPGLQTQAEEIHTGTSKFDLSLIVENQESNLVAWIEYSVDLFAEDTIVRMLGHFEALLEGIVADPSQRLSELPLLTAAERRQILVEWNATQADYPTDLTVHQVLDAQVARTPDAVAASMDESQITFQELNQQANQLAHYLQRLGVGPDVQVGICVERSFEMVIGLLGILKAGGAFVPLDPILPKERLAFMLGDTATPVLLTQQGLRDKLPAHSAREVCLDTEWATIAECPRTDVQCVMSADNLAYTIYTSGSTGKPKGVQITHRGVVNMAYWHHRAYRVTPEDRLPLLAGFGFDATVWELWGQLTIGGSVHVVDREIRTDPERLRDWIVDRAMTIALLPLRIAEVMMTLPWPSRTRLSRVFTGGDRLHRPPPTSCPYRFFNNYGPSEYTVVSSYAHIPPADQVDQNPTIGRPIDNTQIYVLDRFLKPVPVKIPGELYISGVGLARGYLNRPDLTAERFIPNPFSDLPGARLYRTGDLTRYYEDGNIDFLGRLDYQVKIRGIRIEPGEIETVLGQHPAVREAVVIGRESRSGDNRLVAYIVREENQELKGAELHGYLKSYLPDYMIPSAFVLLDSIPINSNGKVDRRALPAPEQAQADSEDSYVGPRTPLEQTLEKIWKEVLDAQRIGIYDNFFLLGGHSLSATQVIVQARAAFGVDIAVHSLFEKPTIADFGQLIEELIQNKSTRAQPAIKRIDRSAYRQRVPNNQSGD